VSNAATPFFRDGRTFPTPAQYAEAMDAYAALKARLGDDPNAIADALGWTRGTGCRIRYLLNERSAGREVRG
jgi:hypothetical protein